MNREEFGIVFAVLAEYFGAIPSEGLTQVYYKLLKDLSIDDFKRACQTVMQNRVYNGLPKVAEIREMIEGKVEDKVIFAFQSLLKAIKKYGCWETIIFEDGAIANAIEGMGGWERINEITAKEWNFKQKDFEEIYIAHLRYGNTKTKKVFGVFDRINRASGQESWNKPILITKDMKVLTYTEENLKFIEYNKE